MISDANLKPLTISQADPVTQILLSTDDNGRITFPDGHYWEVASFLRALSRLDERGHIQHRLQNGYLACYLTESGRLLKSQAIAAQNDGNQATSQAPLTNNRHMLFDLKGRASNSADSPSHC